MIDKFIQELAKEFSVEAKDLATQVAGVYAVPIEENVIVNITDAPPGFTFFCNLGPAKKMNEEAFYTRLMSANLFFQGTKGAVLGLSDDGNRLTLTHHVEYTADYKQFRDLIEDFMNAADYWIEECKKIK